MKMRNFSHQISPAPGPNDPLLTGELECVLLGLLVPPFPSPKVARPPNRGVDGVRVLFSFSGLVGLLEDEGEESRVLSESTSVTTSSAGSAASFSQKFFARGGCGLG